MSSEINTEGFEIIPQCDDTLKPTIGHLFDYVKEFEEAKNQDSDHTNQTNGNTKRRLNTRDGCNAWACVKRTLEGKYILFRFNEGHNHELCTPRKKHLLRSNRKVTDAKKLLISSLDRVNVGVTKAFNIMKEQVGGYENVGFTLRDAQNYSRDLKAMISESDASIFIQILKRIRDKNPAFFFAYALDEDDHLKHIYWADKIERKNFTIFGDLISFDTTYNTNKYSMIFAPFTGINHHRLSVTFGAALLADEKADSFSWLFENFIECMGHEPTLIITDQDPAMKITISRTFPNSIHRFCMWHILKKTSEKVGQSLNADQEFQRCFKDCVWNSSSTDAFKSNWESIIQDFQLTENDWLSHMFEMQKMWIPVYFKDIPFSDLLRTTSRSESENAFFNSFINNKVSLLEFYSRFENAMDSQRQKVLQADYDNLNGTPKLKTDLGLKKHASQLYTPKNFYIFQEELWASCLSCGVKDTYTSTEDRDSTIFTIFDCLWLNEKNREVLYNSSFIACNCKFFEAQGILCRHILMVLKGQAMNEFRGDQNRIGPRNRTGTEKNKPDRTKPFLIRSGPGI